LKLYYVRTHADEKLQHGTVHNMSTIYHIFKAYGTSRMVGKSTLFI